jgi:hypothetical protein
LRIAGERRIIPKGDDAVARWFAEETARKLSKAKSTKTKAVEKTGEATGEKGTAARTACSQSSCECFIFGMEPGSVEFPAFRCTRHRLNYLIRPFASLAAGRTGVARS